MKVKDFIRYSKSATLTESYFKFQEKEKKLNAKFYDTRCSVHSALCGEHFLQFQSKYSFLFASFTADSIDTPGVMKCLKDLVNLCNVYMDDAAPNSRLLESIASYCTQMFRVFGVIQSDVGLGFPVEGVEQVNVEATVTPFASLLADFREQVRQVALEEKC